jgi:hypothetical protein
MLNIDRIDRKGETTAQLHMDVQGETTVRASLIDLYQQQTQSSGLLPLQQGTALVSAVTETGDSDHSCEFTLGTVYQILQSDNQQPALRDLSTVGCSN